MTHSHIDILKLVSRALCFIRCCSCCRVSLSLTQSRTHTESKYSVLIRKYGVYDGSAVADKSAAHCTCECVCEWAYACLCTYVCINIPYELWATYSVACVLAGFSFIKMGLSLGEVSRTTAKSVSSVFPSFNKTFWSQNIAEFRVCLCEKSASPASQRCTLVVSSKIISFFPKFWCKLMGNKDKKQIYHHQNNKCLFRCCWYVAFSHRICRE